MFSRTFNIIMTPAVVLVGLLATGIYLYVGYSNIANGDALAAMLWLFLWGHIFSMLIGALLVLPLLAVLGVLAGSTAWLFSFALKAQRRGVDSLPFTVARKADEEKPDILSH